MDELQKLQSNNVAERAAAAESFSQMGADAAPAAVALVNACADDDSVSEWAVAALEEMGPPPTDSIGPLTMLARSPQPLVAYWAVTLLGRAGSAAGACQDELATVLLESPEISVRERSAWALGKIEARSPAALEALTKVSESDQPTRLARLASEALQQLRE